MRQGLEQAASDCEVVLSMLALTPTVQSVFPQSSSFPQSEVLMIHPSNQLPVFESFVSSLGLRTFYYCKQSLRSVFSKLP